MKSRSGAAIPIGRDFLFLVHFLLPIAMGWSLANVVRHAFGGNFSEKGLILLLAGIAASYSLDRLLERESCSQWLARALWVTLFLGGGAICIILTTRLPGTDSLINVCMLSAVSLLYTQLKRLPIVKTVIVAVTWTWSCSTLPSPHGGPNWISFDVTLPLVFLIAAGCILCDLKDQAEDRRLGIPTLPVLLGLRPSCFISSFMAVVAAVVAIRYHHLGIAVGSGLMALAAQFPAILLMRPVGAILVDAIITIPGILIAAGIV